MDQTQLLEELNAQLDQYKKFKGFIERAKAQEGKFSGPVIEKVCLDNELRMMEVADALGPMLPEVQAQVSDLHGQLSEHGSASDGSAEALEELELRVAIGEMSKKEFEKQSEGLKAQVAEATTNTEAIQSQLDELQDVLDRWADLSGAHPPEEAAPADEEEESVQAVEDDAEGEEEPAIDVVAVEEEAEEEEQDEDDEEKEQDEDDEEKEQDEDDEDDLLVLEDGGDEPDAEDAEVKNVMTEAELSDFPGQFGDSEEVGGFGEPVMDGDTFAFESDSGVPGEGEGPLASEELQAGLASHDAEEPAIEADAEPVQVEESGDEPILEIHSKDDGASVENGADDQTRRALLLYQEGTPEEQSYPFTGDEITIGRGRDNDIQIKNDSKVSRKHCRLFRKEGAFYIQDNKSSNGSLVNGELITERRLFGGEEVIVGETFFRFRIMD